MNLRYLLAGVLVIAVVALASFGLAQITGFIATDGGNPGVEINIDDGTRFLTYDLVLTTKESAFDGLKRVAVVDYRIFTTGAMITGINGVKSDDEHYWLYFVNDEMPEIGADYYYPNDGDVITFRYLTAEESAEYF
jgi:hypothetical protein